MLTNFFHLSSSISLSYLKPKTSCSNRHSFYLYWNISGIKCLVKLLSLVLMVVFFCFFTFRKATLAAFAVGNPSVVIRWCIQLLQHCRYRDQGKCYPLSQVLLFNTASSCWLKTFPARFRLLVWLFSHRFSVHVKRLVRPSVSAMSECAQYECGGGV